MGRRQSLAMIRSPSQQSQPGEDRSQRLILPRPVRVKLCQGVGPLPWCTTAGSEQGLAPSCTSSLDTSSIKVRGWDRLFPVAMNQPEFWSLLQGQSGGQNVTSPQSSLHKLLGGDSVIESPQVPIKMAML
jgi:hypothetical protein